MSIIKRLNRISGLPTLPEVALKVQQIVFSDDESTGAVRLARIIEQDPSLTAMILRFANSGYYGGIGRISTVSMAITRLGFNEIGHIIVATSIIKNLSPDSNVLDYRNFWRHALTAAHMASMAPRISKMNFTEEERQALYLSGLLHDIGILVYDQFFPEEFAGIIRYAVEHEISYLEAEAATTQDTHAHVGAALLEMWKLSAPTINGVRFHHSPERAADNLQTIPFAIYLSEYILCNSGLGSFEGHIVRQTGSLLDELSINSEDLPGYLSEAQKEVERSDLILAINGPPKAASEDTAKLLRTV